MVVMAEVADSSIIGIIEVCLRSLDLEPLSWDGCVWGKIADLDGRSTGLWRWYFFALCGCSARGR